VASLREMSLLWSLRKYVDSIEHRQQEDDRKKKREVRPAEADGADGEVELVPKVNARIVDGACRVCGYEGDAKSYCPTCLAETMEP